MNRKMTIDSLDAKETMKNKTEIKRAEAYLAAEIRNKQDKTSDRCDFQGGLNRTKTTGGTQPAMKRRKRREEIGPGQ